MKRILDIILVLGLLILDQVSEALAVANLKEAAAIPIIKNVFELQYLENHGAAFGSMQGKQIFLQGFTIIVLILLLFIYIKMPADKRYNPLKLTTILLFAGAIGNMIDRVIQGYVVDFFYFKLIDFPIFNVADCYVTVAAFLLVFLILFVYKEEDLDFISKKKEE